MWGMFCCWSGINSYILGGIKVVVFSKTKKLFFQKYSKLNGGYQS